ncbi:S-adenosylmethionine:tRNA ribosyltransferase-isomerase, partial [Bacillus sp. SIMBA_005]
MRVEDFDFELPEELIAQTPLVDRTASRLMVVTPGSEKVEHHHFAHILEELH